MCIDVVSADFIDSVTFAAAFYWFLWSVGSLLFLLKLVQDSFTGFSRILSLFSLFSGFSCCLFTLVGFFRLLVILLQRWLILPAWFYDMTFTEVIRIQLNNV